MVTRMFDAFTDPAIGYLSDRTDTRIGRRKPWIIAGYALTMVVIYFLFIPPEKITAFFFLFWYAMMYFAWTMAEIPYMAWQAELSHDYEQRTRIVTYRIVMLSIGGLIFAIFPMMPIFATSAITPEVLRLLAYTVLIGLPITVFIAVVFAPTGKPIATRQVQSFFVILKSMTKNKPMMIFLTIQVVFGLGSGMQTSVLFIWIDTYLQIGEKYPQTLLIVSFLGLGAMPVWLKVINWIGKHQTWLTIQIGFMAALPFLAFIKPGPQAYISFLTMYIIICLIIAAGDIVPNTIVGDIIDYDTLKSGENRAGQYSSVMTLIMKANYAVGSGIGFYILGIAGYDATAKNHSANEAIGLMMVLIWIPIVLTAISCIFVWRFPLNQHRQSIIKRRIESLAARKIKKNSTPKANI